MSGSQALIIQIGSPLAQLKNLQQQMKVMVNAMVNAIIRSISIVGVAVHQQADIPKQHTQYSQINIKCI